jgi:PAS domain-containing protein
MNVKSDYHIFREIFEKSPVGMLLFDREGMMVDANQSALEIMGITTPENPPEINLFHNPIISCKKEELVGKSIINFQNQLNFPKIRDFYNITPPDHVNNESIGGIETTGIEGTISVISSSYLVQIQHSGSKDESDELLLSEEKYKNFFEDDLTGDFIATPQGDIIECNPAFAEIYNFPNREQALKSNISTFNPEDWETLTKRLKREYKIQGQPVGTYAVPVAIACSLSFMLPMADPTVAMAYGTGYVKIKEILKAGVPLVVIGIIVTIFILLSPLAKPALG